MTRLLPLETNTDVVTLTLQVNGDELPGHLSILAVEVLREVNRIACARIRVVTATRRPATFPSVPEIYSCPATS